ncbi:hypothetical protein [Bacillus atrophaeus]|uniref:hypothetical protein n=1 Tax=Bacillus atrophaeus TaxID=1452 RepID=UPI0022805999|nr:hypothetical protein [Bacillus atrophaeus]MCY8856477.1 hypothetical protein [Bacillus atrophaeus]
MEENYETNGYDISVIYDYKEYPDVKFGRCDNCALFKSSVKSGQFLRECRRCGMKKSI